MAGNRPRPMSDTPMSSGSQQTFNVHVDLRGSQIAALCIEDNNVVNFQSRRRLHLENITSHSLLSLPANTQGAEGSHRGAKRKQGTLNFAQQKRKSNSKLRSSNSSKDELALTTPSPDLLEAITGSKESLAKAFGIINQLHPLRDSGKWEEFQKIADCILERKGDLESELLVLLERAVVVSYQKDPDRSLAMLESGLKILRESKFEDMYLFYFLTATALIHQTGFYRRQNRHGDAENSLALARQSASAIKSGYLQAILAYESASNQSKYVSLLPSNKIRRANLVNKVKNTMEECISICVQMDRDKHYIRKDHFGLTKLAPVDLNCRTRMARSEPVKANCLKDARKYIERLEKYEHQGEISVGNRIQLWVAKSDLDFRLNNLQAAKVEAKRALEMAKKFGFNLEISPISERLEYISQLMESLEERSLAERRSCQWSVTQGAQSPSSLSSSPPVSRRYSPSSSDCEL